MDRCRSSQSGVALLMALGILALLSILGAAFSTNMRLMERTTRDFVYEIQGRYLAEAGIEYAIAELKEDVRNDFVFNNNVSISNQTGLLDGAGSIENIVIRDCASRIDINYASKELLDTVISGVGPILAQRIVVQRNGPDLQPGRANYDDDSDGVEDEEDELGADGSDDRLFLTPKSIATVEGIGDDIYKDNKEFITAWGYCDPNTQDKDGNNSPRQAVNIHTANEDLIRILVKAIYDIGPNGANNVINSISGKTFNSWKEFNDAIDPISGAEDIEDNFNPNRRKPDWDGERASTEFCFHSGGRYEISATGKITKNNKVLAQKTISTTVKISDLWNQTTKEQFRQVWENDKGTSSGEYIDGEIFMVTWFDSCPVVSSEDWGLRTVKDYRKIEDSLKIGYWDNFDEETKDYYNNFPEGEWQDLSGFLNRVKNGDDNVLNIKGPNGNVLLADENKWNLTDYSLIIWERDEPHHPGSSSEDWGWNVGWLISRYVNKKTDDGIIYNGLDSHNNGELVIGYVGVGPSWPSFPALYTAEKLYKVIRSGDYITYWVDLNLDGEFEHNPGGLRYAPKNLDDKGILKLIMMGDKPRSSQWDNLRIIPATGYYISPPSNQVYNPLNLTDGVQWGTLWGTVTLPEENAGTVKFKASTNSQELQDPNGSKELSNENERGISLSGIGNSTSIQYGTYFECGDTENYFKTPVLEDVWITYLPKTKILYWREGAEE